MSKILYTCIILLLLCSCKPDKQLFTYYLATDKNDTLALFKFKKNRDSVFGNIFYLSRKDTLLLKGDIRDSLFVVKTYRNGVDEDYFQYLSILKDNNEILLTRKDNHLATEDQLLLKPISSQLYKSIQSKALASPTLSTLKKDTIIGKYLFKLKVDKWNPKTMYGMSTLQIIDRNTGTRLQLIKSDEFYFNRYLSFDYIDVNFDKLNDLVFFNGFNGGYGSPTYDYYIYNAITNKFIYNKQLASIAGYLGITIDDKKQRIISYSKSGCCWHQQEAYIPMNNQFIAVKELIIDHDFPVKVILKTKLNGKWKVNERIYNDLTDQQVDSIYKAF